MLLARDYGFFKNNPTFFESLTPEELLFADLEILNRVVAAENEAIEKSRKETEDRPALDSHPGLKKRLTWEDILERKGIQ